MKTKQTDPQALEDLAAKLNRQARSIIVTSQFVWVLALGLGAYIASNFMLMAYQIPTLLGVLIGYVIGNSLGRSRSLIIRAHAATLLCLRDLHGRESGHRGDV